jgi:HlyD family secretion protein
MKKPVIIASIVCLVVGFPIVKKIMSNDHVRIVQTEALSYKPIRASIIASGNLDHQEKVQLSTEVIGKVKAIMVREGDAVQKGQLLLQIDDEAYVSAVEQHGAAVRMQKIAIQRMQLNYANLKQQWSRKKVLFDRQLIDQQAFDAIELEVLAANLQIKSGDEQLVQAEAQLAKAENDLIKTRAYSPISGVVTSLTIQVGETAISGTMNYAASSLMTIADPSSLYADINVDEADIAKIAIGQRAEVLAVAYSEQPIIGEVVFIGQTAKVASGRNGLSFAVKIRIDSTETMRLWPGMSARAEIFTSDNTEKLAVSIQALVSRSETSESVKRNVNRSGRSTDTAMTANSNHYIFVNDQGRARRVGVLLGLSDDEYQEIEAVLPGALSIGDQIILGPDRVLRYLESGQRVVTDSAISAAGLPALANLDDAES